MIVELGDATVHERSDLYRFRTKERIGTTIPLSFSATTNASSSSARHATSNQQLPERPRSYSSRSTNAAS